MVKANIPKHASMKQIRSVFAFICFKVNKKVMNMVHPNYHLKVPKCEIFDGSDFHDFYTIKSLWESDFGVKIKKFIF
jgi:hypothetical protein